MEHSIESHKKAIAHIESHHGHHAKKVALFDAIHAMIIDGITECEAAGSIEPFKQGAQEFVKNRDLWVAGNLL